MIPKAFVPDQREETERTVLLAIELREGFDGDTVQVCVAGKTVLDKEGVRTNYSVGIADVVKTEVVEGPVVVEIAVPTQDLSACITIEDIADTPYLEVKRIEDTIRFKKRRRMREDY